MVNLKEKAQNAVMVVKRKALPVMALLCQRVIHKFTFDRLNSTLNYLYEKRRIEISDFWSC